MKRPVLVTVSGMVGTGKTTAVRHIMDVMQRAGVEAEPWRFQRLPCITLRLGSSRSHPRDCGERSQPARRGDAYARRELTASKALGYLLRMVAFRIYCRWPPSPPWVVLNRYFYDSFPHYDLDKGRGHFYFTALRRMLPKPDLAFLMVASPQTLAARRPQYSTDYIMQVEGAYRGLRAMFPELIEINSEADRGTLERVAAAVRQRLAR